MLCPFKTAFGNRLKKQLPGGESNPDLPSAWESRKMRPGEPAEGSSRAGSSPPQAIARRQLSYILRSTETQNLRFLFIRLPVLALLKLVTQLSIRYYRVTRSCKVDLNHTGLRSRLFQA